MKFTKSDLSSVTMLGIAIKYPTINKTLANLMCENTAENHILNMNKIVGYLKCLEDLGHINHSEYNIMIDNMKNLRNMCKKSQH